MTKFITASKKAMSLLLAMLLTFSCMAVAVSAEGHPYTLDKTNCDLNVDNKTITVKNATVKIDETDFTVKFEIKNDNTVPSNVLANNDTLFYNLENGKTYTVSGYVEIPGEGEESAATKKTVTNDFNVTLKKGQNAPLAPIPEKIKAKVVEVKAITEAEYAIVKKDSGEPVVYGDSNIFKNLDPVTEYVIYIRYKENDDAYASPATSITVKTLEASDQTVPATPVLADKTNTTISVVKVEGQIYSIDGGANWQSSPDFKGLKEKTSYTIITRKIYDPEKQEETPLSDGLAVITNKRACYYASFAKCSMKLAKDEPIYVDTEFGFNFICDTPGTADLVYGDTQYVAVSYTTNQNEKVTECSVKKYTPTTLGDLKFTVKFEKQKFNGSDWVGVGTETKEFKYDVVPKYYKILEGLKKVINVLLNTIPAAINNFIKSGTMNKIFDAIVNIGKKAA